MMLSLKFKLALRKIIELFSTAFLSKSQKHVSVYRILGGFFEPKF